jgi:hypothetical protein
MSQAWLNVSITALWGRLTRLVTEGRGDPGTELHGVAVHRGELDHRTPDHAGAGTPFPSGAAGTPYSFGSDHRTLHTHAGLAYPAHPRKGGQPDDREHSSKHNHCPRLPLLSQTRHRAVGEGRHAPPVCTAPMQRGHMLMTRGLLYPGYTGPR